MYRFIWLVPLLPSRRCGHQWLARTGDFVFPKRLIGGIAVGSIALAFLITLASVYSYAFGSHAIWPNVYVTSQDGNSYSWIPGGAVRFTQGGNARTVAAVQEEARKEFAELSTEQREGQATVSVLRGVNEVEGASLLDVEWSYQLDALSSIFMLVVTGVGLCIFVFATGYMHGEAGFYRFFAYMGLFMFSMLVLVMGSNFLMMFVGWEGVGLCSYLLIGYYFDRQEAANASRKAFITNRVGDFGFALAIFGVIATFGTTQYTDVFSQAANFPLEPLGQWGILSWIALGLFIGACGKSAQLPLHVWLPDAMAGPTPVSALIHAATMVTAGLYMLTRTNVIFQHSQTMMTGRRRGRRSDRAVCSHDWHYSKRHQESAGVFNSFAARLHVHGLRRRRICNRNFSRGDARVFQSAHVSRRRQRDPRYASRAGHADAWAGSGSTCPTPT